MRAWQIFQTLQFVEQFTKMVTETRKYTRITLILVVCLISLPILFSVHKNSKLGVFDSFDRSTEAKKLEENVRNNSTKLLGGVGNDTTKLPLGEQNNSSLKPPITTTMPIKDQHKMVEDVLESRFSKESCISRYEYSSYLKNKKHYKPSTYLISKLRSYEKLHAQCGPQSLSYRKIIRKLSKSHSINGIKTMECKYLVWTPTNGLGNRMVSMASAFLYSILQNRVFLVEFEADMDGLFCEPFPNSTWLLPKNFPHKNNWSQLSTFKYRENSGEYRVLPSFMHINIQHGHGDYNLRHFHCNGTLSVLEKIPALILKSDQYFVPSLFMISSFKEELNKMFPKKDVIFHHLGHYLFNPSNEAWGLITRFYQAYLAKSQEKIGLHIRLFHHQKVSTQKILSQILSCTQSQNILPSFADTKSKQNFPWQNSTIRSKALLIASLYPEYAEELRSLYWTRPTITGDVVGVYQPSHEEYQKFGDNMHNLKALAEIYLVSLCDVIVTSPLSTFGYVAQSLGGSKPWIMVSFGMNGHQNMPCKRGFSMEPCFHVPPQYDCKDKTKINDFASLYSQLKACDDAWWGAKLVDT
ncbi:Galactoside 2-alpha-L-fucosyltransferase [Bienertia sinuspersici]